MRRRFITISIAAALFATPASAATQSTWEEQGQQWVQVNSCGGQTIGVRASQPGDSAGSAMATRFSFQWRRPSTGAWEAIPGAGSSWIDAGPGPWLSRESGWNQTFAPAPPGTSFRIRGVVTMRWGSGRTATLVAGPCTIG